MDIILTSPSWADAEHTQIDVIIGTEAVRLNAIPGLTHYDSLVASGVDIAPYVPPKITTVTPRQARLALLGAGLLDQVEAAVKTAGGATQITWEYASAIDRADPLITVLGQALQLTDAQIDALFASAAQL